MTSLTILAHQSRSAQGQWVGAERGVRRPVSPHLPLLPYVRLSHLYGSRLEVSFSLAASFGHPQEHSPAFTSREMALRHPPNSGPSPMHQAFLGSVSGTSPPPTTTAECPLPFAWFWSYLALGPPIPPGRFPFSALFTLGPLGIPWRVGPPSTRRSHYHPSEGFPCPIPWTLQRGLGGGYPRPYPAHCGSQPEDGVISRLIRLSHLTAGRSPVR
jgi:hypothetical protein